MQPSTIFFYSRGVVLHLLYIIVIRKSHFPQHWRHLCVYSHSHTHTHTHTHIHTSNAHTHYKHIYNTTNKYALSHIVIFSTCLASLLVILSFHCLTDDTDVHIACQDKIVERTDAHRYVLAFSEISIQHVVSILPILRDYMGGTLRLRPIPF